MGLKEQGSCYGNRLARSVSRETEMSQLKRSQQKASEEDRSKERKREGYRYVRVNVVTGSMLYSLSL